LHDDDDDDNNKCKEMDAVPTKKQFFTLLSREFLTDPKKAKVDCYRLTVLIVTIIHTLCTLYIYYMKEWLSS